MAITGSETIVGLQGRLTISAQRDSLPEKVNSYRFKKIKVRLHDCLPLKHSPVTARESVLG